jgi:hypothetical protein
MTGRIDFSGAEPGPSFTVALDPPRPPRVEASDTPAGTVGYIGWDRLVEMMQRDGEVKLHERVTYLRATPGGLQFVVVRR